MSDDRGPYPEPSVRQIERRSEVMAGYPPELRDAVFPVRSANTVVATCRRIITMLQTDIDARRDGFPPLDEWEGSHRRTFDEAWDQQSGGLTAFSEELQRLIGSIDSAVDAVDSFNRNQTLRREEHDRAREAESDE